MLAYAPLRGIVGSKTLAEPCLRTRLHIDDLQINALASLPFVDLRRKRQTARAALRHQLVESIRHAERNRLQRRVVLPHPETEMIVRRADAARFADNLQTTGQKDQLTI